MTTLSANQENVTVEIAQASAGLLERLLDRMINALDAYFGLVEQEVRAELGVEDHHFSDTCRCG